MKFLFRAQDQNMTNGDFAFFTFKLARTAFTDQPWTRDKHLLRDPDEMARRRRAFVALKQVYSPC